MGPWPERHGDRQRERHWREDEWGRVGNEKIVTYTRQDGEGEVEKEQGYVGKWDDDKKKTITRRRMKVRMRDDKRDQDKRERGETREKETACSVKVEEENVAFICCFHLVLAKHQAPRSPLWHTFLSCQCVLQKYRITVEDEKTDCGLDFKTYSIAFARLLRS